MFKINLIYTIPVRKLVEAATMSTITVTETIAPEMTLEKSTLNLIAQRRTFLHPVTKLIKTKSAEPLECNIPNCPCKTPCPPGCSCRPGTSFSWGLVANVFGILLAIFATYMIVSTNSNLYLVFWIGYSVLRRMMSKSKKLIKSD